MNYPNLLNLGVIGAVKVNAVHLDLIGVPGNATISRLESRVGDTVKAHDLVKLGVSLTQSDSEVGNF